MNMKQLVKIKNRIYANYFMPSRLEEYKSILKNVIESGYTIITVRDYYKGLLNNTLNGKYFINRHDIDTIPTSAKEMFEIEKSLGVKGTYYFRLSTIDIELMKEIRTYGSEASYHFEELAQYAKDNHIKSKDKVLEDIEKIREIFIKNFLELERKLGYKMETVCSHGDFVNRQLKCINYEITNSKELRQKLGILCEAYDKDLKDHTLYTTDAPYPKFWNPIDVRELIGKGDVIYMLTHARHWKKNIIRNTMEDLKRFYEGYTW